VLVTVIDISERKHAEEVLKTSEQKYRGLMENASDAILLSDTQGNIVEANRKAAELLGYAIEELLQMHYTQLHPMPELERTIAAFKEIIKKNTGHLSGGLVQRKNGDIVPVDITGSVIKYNGRKAIQGSFRDISEHRQAKDILEKLVKERTSELSRINEQLKLEIKERKSAEVAMKRKSRELKQHTGKLSELNAALKVLLKQREDDKNDVEEKVTSNVKELLLPYIEEIKNRKIDPKSKIFLSIIETNLQNIISPFTQRLSSKYLGLTPREVQVADLIRQGKNTKEIARFMGISASAISLHRYHIREKLGLIDQKTNLQTHLQTLL
jgi:PAS domain S-box-containing protein